MKRIAPAGACALLALFFWMAVSVSREHGPVADETLHLTAGYSYWLTNDYRLQPENGWLPQRWAALPLLLSRPHFPGDDPDAWKSGDVAKLGYDFFYGEGNSARRLLLRGRIMIALLGVACGALVYRWSRSLFGPAGGLLSTAFFAFCPNVLAHAGIVTSDMAATLAFPLAVLACWLLLHRVTPGRVAAAGAALALLALSKFSAPIIVPVAVLLAAVRALRGAPLPVRFGTKAARLRGGKAAWTVAGSFALAAFFAWALVWAAYGFRYGAINPAAQGGHLNQTWETVLIATPPAGNYPPAERALLRPGLVEAAIGFARDRHLLPEAWLYGFAHTYRFSRWRPAFLLGGYRTTGWVAFFPVAFALKTPLPLLGCLVLAAAIAIAGARRPFLRGKAYRLAPLVLFIAVYGAFALTSHLDIGHRHLLPIYPALHILAGAAALGFGRRAVAIVAAALVVLDAADSIAIRPDYLAYFNPLLGGPSAGYRKLIDSSLDWGQDLPGLKRWLDAHAPPATPVFLSYFGSDDPASEGIKATRIADSYFDFAPRPLMPRMTGGIYCIGATMFQQVYTLVRHGWTEQHERKYEEDSRWLAHTRIADLGHVAGPDGRLLGRDAAIARLSEFEQLRFGRLCAFLHARQPDAEVGHSILIFLLTDADVNRFLYGPPPVPFTRP